MKLVVFADSKAMPRAAEAGNVPVESTYLYQLERLARAQANSVILDRSSRALSLKQLVTEELDDIALYGFDRILIQVGGADCFPHTLLPHERKFLTRPKVHRLGAPILRMEKKLRWLLLKSGLRRELVPLHEFEKLVVNLKRWARSHRLVVHWIELIPLSRLRMRSLPGAESNRVAYNRIVQNLADETLIYVSLESMTREPDWESRFLIDGMHFTAAGARFLSQQIAKALNLGACESRA